MTDYRHAKWHVPTTYVTPLAVPLQRPKLVVLRVSCGHILGVGVIYKRQSYVIWKRCGR